MRFSTSFLLIELTKMQEAKLTFDGLSVLGNIFLITHFLYPYLICFLFFCNDKMVKIVNQVLTRDTKRKYEKLF